MFLTFVWFVVFVTMDAVSVPVVTECGEGTVEVEVVVWCVSWPLVGDVVSDRELASVSVSVY